MTTARDTAPCRPQTGVRAGFVICLGEGETLHVWQKPVDKASPSRVEVQAAGGATSALIGAPSDDFMMTTYVAAVEGEVGLAWDEADTLVSLCYAFDPAHVLEKGIRVLWTREETRANAKRYRLHLAPPFGWMNDPNGLIEIGGLTHVFYQHYPHARHWDTMHWGHAVSANLVDWTQLPVFLHPRPDDARRSDESRGRLFGLRHRMRRGRPPHLPHRPRGRAPTGTRMANDGGCVRHDQRRPFRRRQLSGVRPCRGSVRILGTRLFSRGPDGLGRWCWAERFSRPLSFCSTRTDAILTPPRAGVSPGYCIAKGLIAPFRRSVRVLSRSTAKARICLRSFSGSLAIGDPATNRKNPSFVLVGRFDGVRFEEIARRELDFIGDCYAFQSFVHRSRPVGIAWAANWADVRRLQDFPSSMTFPASTGLERGWLRIAARQVGVRTERATRRERGRGVDARRRVTGRFGGNWLHRRKARRAVCPRALPCRR